MVRIYEEKSTSKRFLYGDQKKPESIFFYISNRCSWCGFFSGVRATQPDMQMSADAFYDQSMLMDIRVLSELGMTEGDLEAISQIRGVKHVMPSFSQDVLCDTDSSQLVVGNITCLL